MSAPPPASTPPAAPPPEPAPGVDDESLAAPEEVEAELEETRRRYLSWRRLLLQAAAFVVGAALVAWLVYRATSNPQMWERLREASAGQVVALLGCSLASLVINGAIFWLAVRPVHRLPFLELQWVNAMAGMLNYAPVRLGVVARIAWHLRVDRMHVRHIVAWFASVTVTVLVPLGAAVAAAMTARRLDGLFLLVLAVLVIAAGLILPRLASLPAVRRRAHGAEKVLTDPFALWGCLILRVVDLSLWSLRMMIAVSILGIHLSAQQSFMLAMANLAITLNPLGRVGFHEATVALVAAAMTSGSGGDLVDTCSQLAVVESAGEFVVAVPAGLLALVILRRGWRRAAPRARPPSAA